MAPPRFAGVERTSRPLSGCPRFGWADEMFSLPLSDSESKMSKAGVYLHIPFCRSRCSYCDFATDVYKSAEAVERYVTALIKEVNSFQDLSFQIPHLKSPITVDTIYFGGGTPSLLSPQQVEKILDAVYKHFTVDENSEITMELNPATATRQTISEYKNLGINRASFGAQTFDDTELRRLGRKHTAQDVRETIAMLREADFNNISFDLIAGLPRQTLADWERNLSEALKLKPEHLSLYLLEIHESTPLAEQIRSGRQPLPDEELAAEMYELMLEKVTDEDYRQYEISNFCLPGFESKHNSKYWTLDAVYGFGCSAHSFDGKKSRWSNERDTLKYVELVEKTYSAIIDKTVVNPQSEYLFLGLRLNKGISLKDYRERYGKILRDEYAGDLSHLLEAGLIIFEGDFLKLTPKGRLYSNEVFSVFV